MRCVWYFRGALSPEKALEETVSQKTCIFLIMELINCKANKKIRNAG